MMKVRSFCISLLLPFFFLLFIFLRFFVFFLVFEVRQIAITVIGRLCIRNPAYVMPSIRKTMIQLLTDLKFGTYLHRAYFHFAFLLTAFAFLFVQVGTAARKKRVQFCSRTWFAPLIVSSSRTSIRFCKFCCRNWRKTITTWLHPSWYVRATCLFRLFTAVRFDFQLFLLQNAPFFFFLRFRAHSHSNFSSCRLRWANSVLLVVRTCASTYTFSSRWLSMPCKIKAPQQREKLYWEHYQSSFRTLVITTFCLFVCFVLFCCFFRFVRVFVFCFSEIFPLHFGCIGSLLRFDSASYFLFFFSFS